MKNSEFLDWLAERLVHVYGENENVDFVHKLKIVADHVRKLEQPRCYVCGHRHNKSDHFTGE